jgi:hypothetical protein
MRSALEQLRTALASAYPLIMLVSPEEDRLESLLNRIAGAARPEPLPVLVWNCADGFTSGGPSGMLDPMDALSWVGTDSPQGFYLFKDLSRYVTDQRVLRRLRDTAMKVRNSGRFLFLMAPAVEVPELLRPLSYVVVSLFPDEPELTATVTQLLKDRKVGDEQRERLVDTLKGMSLTEVEHLLRRLLDAHAELDAAFFGDVLDEKEQITRKEGILEFVPPDERLASLGGLDRLKTWVRERSDLFTPEARRSDLPRPKGVLMMGMSGCGKSLAVKVIAREWGLPLFRLDMNLVFAGVQGSPEWVFHRALEAVESVAPAVLWIDEIEMGVAGYNEGQTGSMTRIFSTRSTGPRSSSPPPPTAFTSCRPRSSARADSTRSSSSTFPMTRNARRFSASTSAATASTRRVSTSSSSPPQPAPGTAPRSSRRWRRR